MTHAFTSQGTQLQRGNGASPEVFTTVVEITSVDGPTEKAKTIDVSSFDSAYHEYILGLPDGGEVSASGNLIANSTTQQNIHLDLANGTRRNFRLIMNDNVSTPTTIAFAGYVMEWQPKGAVDKQVEVSFKIKVTGVPTYTWNSGVTP